VEDLSLHILDIAENALRADAKKIEIAVSRDMGKDLLVIEIRDDGRGMDRETLSRVRDPFFTTKEKKTGLGLPLLAQAAEQAGGGLTIESAPGKGTRVTVTFAWGHIDRPALGDVAGTVMTLIAGHPDVDVVYEERNSDAVARMDTAEIKQDLEGVPINDPAVLDAIRSMLKRDFILMNEGTTHE
jgi:hypothetical protein